MSREQSSPARGWTGGAAGASGLVLITLVRSEGRLTIDPARSAHFVIRDESQHALRQVFGELEEFVSGCGINEMVLRRAQPSGPDAAGWKARRIETAVELLPGFAVHSANNQSLSRWSKVHADKIPPLKLDPPRHDRRLYEGAVAAARVAFGMDAGEMKLVDGCVR